MSWKQLLTAILQIKRNYTTRRQLALLTKQQLQDLGLTAEDARVEADKASCSQIIKELFAELQKITS